jgi:hypothetical protein
MTPQNVGITDLSRSAYESACRDFWRASVKVDLDDGKAAKAHLPRKEHETFPQACPAKTDREV